MTNTNCEVMQDLLPLYVDGCCSKTEVQTIGINTRHSGTARV